MEIVIGWRLEYDGDLNRMEIEIGWRLELVRVLT